MRASSLRARSDHRPSTWLFRAGATLFLALVPPGCGLILDLDPPPPNGLECFATVRSADGHEVVISSRQHPDFVERMTTPSGEETAELREYFVDGEGSGCARATSADAAREDWRLWVRDRIAQVAAAPASGSDFSLFAGPWCEVPDSVTCVHRDSHSPASACGAALAGSPLPACAPAPPPVDDPCLEIECGGPVPCDVIEFPDTPVGSSDSRTVRLRNCGAAGAPEISLVLDGSIQPLPGTPLRDFIVSRNTCLPDTPMEMAAGEEILTNPLLDAVNASCELDVEFRPLSPRDHGGQIVFRSSLDPRHRIDLKGVAVGGGLFYSVPDLPDPRAIPDALCVDGLTGGCSRERVVEVVNGGPGEVTIRDIAVVPDTGPTTGWQLVAPPLPLPAGGLTLGPADPPLQIRLRWCNTAPGDDATLVVDSNDPTQPTFILKLERLPTGSCPPGR